MISMIKKGLFKKTPIYLKIIEFIFIILPQYY